jgi:hypothetical protein
MEMTNESQEDGSTDLDDLDGDTILGSSGFTAINKSLGSRLFNLDV